MRREKEGCFTRPESRDPDVEAFLEKARKDIEAARRLLPGGDLSDVVCFHSQQAAEKALKAVLLASGLEIPRSHDLGRLVDELVAIDPAWEEARLDAEALSDFAVAPRYPGWEILAPDADPAAALEKAARILEAVLARL